MSPEDRSHWPAEPDPQALEQQYGEEAELYAEVRAKAAASAGRSDAAEEWSDAGDEIEAADAEDEEE